MKKNEIKYILRSYCGVFRLATDNCLGMGEVISTFKEVYKYYVGRMPRENIVKKFLREGVSQAKNGELYTFFLEK